MSKEDVWIGKTSIQIGQKGFIHQPKEIIEYIKYLQTQLQQKENIIKEAREDLDKQIEFCNNEANGTTNDKYCRIAIQYLKHLKQILDKEVN